MLIKLKSYVQMDIIRVKSKDKIINFSFFLRELLLLLWVSRVVIGVNGVVGTVCKPNPELPIPWFGRDLALSFGVLASGPYS